MFLVSLGFAPISYGQLDWSGQIQSSISASTLPDYSYLDAYNWARFSATGDLPQGKWNLSLDLAHTYLNKNDSVRVRLPLAYIDWYTEKADIRIGHQYVSWSRADLAIVSDILSPVDLTRFLSRDFELIKQGITAINYTRYSGSNFWQLVINPVYRTNTIPDPDSRWFPLQLFPDNFPIQYREPQTDRSIYDIQFAGRYAWRSNVQFDLDIGLYWWHNPNPAYHKELNTQTVGQIQVSTGLRFTETYTQSWMGTLSGNFNGLEPYVLTAEVFYQHDKAFDFLPGQISPADLDDISPALLSEFASYFQQKNEGLLLDKPSLTWMAGIQRELWDWTFSAQFIQERILNYDTQIIQKEAFNYATLLLQRSFLRDKLQFMLQGRYHFLHGDYWIYPRATYDLMDNLNVEAGAHFFGGGTTPTVYGHLSLSEYRANSLGFIRLNCYF